MRRKRAGEEVLDRSTTQRREPEGRQLARCADARSAQAAGSERQGRVSCRHRNAPRGSAAKLEYDPDLQVFTLSKASLRAILDRLSRRSVTSPKSSLASHLTAGASGEAPGVIAMTTDAFTYLVEDIRVPPNPAPAGLPKPSMLPTWS